MLVGVSNKPAASQRYIPHIPTPGSPPPTATAQGRGVFAVHAIIYLLFGLSTIFIQTPDWGTGRLLIGGLLLALGASHWWASRRTYGSATSATLISVALVQGASGALLLAQPDAPAPIVLVTCGGIGLGAFLKGLLGVRYRLMIAAARDWVLEGTVMFVAALILPLMANIGPKAVLGVTGGGALIAGVFLLVGAFGAPAHSTPEA